MKIPRFSIHDVDVDQISQHLCVTWINSFGKTHWKRDTRWVLCEEFNILDGSIAIYMMAITTKWRVTQIPKKSFTKFIKNFSILTFDFRFPQTWTGIFAQNPIYIYITKSFVTFGINQSILDDFVCVLLRSLNDDWIKCFCDVIYGNHFITYHMMDDVDIW